MTDSKGPLIASISRLLSQEEPIEGAARETAAVAVVFRPAPSGDEVLLIKRAEREGDPWSGDVAFPGGRFEEGDATFKDTAVREAREEVGADLAAEASFLGYMGPFQARRKGIWVVPAVFLVTGKISVVGNGEVYSHKWVRFKEFLSPENRSTYAFMTGEGQMRLPAFKLQGYEIWGLTERILTSLTESLA